MAGYDFHAGMSNNAVDAYNSGVKPISQITADDLREAGWKATKALAVRLAKAGVWSACEWHHSGGTWFNKVQFYDPRDLVESWNDLTGAEQDEYLTPNKSAEQTAIRVKGTYAVFGGSRRRPRYLGDEAFEGDMIGNWIHLDGGGKKKADGRHITYSRI